MTGNFWLDWAIMAVSLINVILQFWLGLTILLNAERRTWGVWLAGGGLLLGAAFFISHTAILGFSQEYFSRGLNVWWRIGWIPVIALPFIWYMIMLWYAGFWRDRRRPYLPNRQQGRVLFTFFLLVGLIAWLVVATPLPSFTQVIALELSTVPTVGGIPVFLLIYPLYIILCIGLAVNVLRHPGPSDRMMADQARHRARPWLLATSMVLLLVSLLVAGFIIWVLLNARDGMLLNRDPHFGAAVAWFDLVIAALIAAAVGLIGQAVVSYEVFTGKALPRRELQRYWRNAVILAVGYGIVAGWSFSLQEHPIYLLLLTTILMVLFYALLSWRSYTWRERYIRNLRPFVASQNLYEHLLASSVPATIDVELPFKTLCQEVLGARLGYLAAFGPLAPLVRPLSYPADIPIPASQLSQVVTSFDSPQTMCVPVKANLAGGMRWAVPLWSERGLIGLFLLGPKRDGGLYTQEEIEIARASGERLIDTRASAEIARRLMTLQRERLAQSQILDQQTRRILHDDVLPNLHAVLLKLSSAPANGATADTIATLTNVHRQISDLLHQMPKTPVPTLERLGLVGALKHTLAHDLSGVFKSVTWQVEPKAEDVLNALPPLTTEVLFYAAREAMRNAARHGRGDDAQRMLHLNVSIIIDRELQIQVKDDGVGLETTQFSGSGSGRGLALHSTMLAIIGGSLDLESTPNVYTSVTLSLPQQTLADQNV